MNSFALNAVAEVSGRLVAVGAGEMPILTSGDGRDWTPVDTGSAALMDVVAGGPGAIAVGSAGETATVWTSPDGVAWTAVEDPEGVFTGPGSQIADVAVGGPGFVAVGRRGDAPAVWESSDGIAWSLATEEPGILGGIEAVAQGGPGLVAVGHVAAGPRSSPASMTSPPPPGTDPGEFGSWAAVWTSADGVSWSRLEHDPVVFGEGSDTGMWAVVPGGPGLLAVGGGSVDGAEGLVAWTSVDGQTWAKVLVEHYPVGGGEIYEVISTSGGFVAVGTDNRGSDDQAGVWSSVDGRTWHKSADPALGGAKYEGMNGIVETDAGLVAVGFWEAPETPEDQAGSDENADADADMPPEPGEDSAAAVWVMDKT